MSTIATLAFKTKTPFQRGRNADSFASFAFVSGWSGWRTSPAAPCCKFQLPAF